MFTPLGIVLSKICLTALLSAICCLGLLAGEIHGILPDWVWPVAMGTIIVLIVILIVCMFSLIWIA